MSKGFTARRVAGLRPRVAEITAALLDAMADRAPAGETEVDLIEAFAFPLPVIVICELLGVPAGDRDSFKEWSHAMLASVGEPGQFRAAGDLDVLLLQRAARGEAETPADDLVSALIAVRDAGDSAEQAEEFDERELVAMLFLLLVAGHETTANLIASGTLALLTHPAELDRLRGDPSLLPRAVEELLRYANPLNHATERFTLEPVRSAGSRSRPASGCCA